MWWPAADRTCHVVVYRELALLDKALAYVRDWTMAVQAGGNAGVWPLHLAKHFVEVITFEPDAENFACLKLNTEKTTNIHAYDAALGSSAARCAVRHESAVNCGAHFVEYDAGDVPVMALDALDLKSCGLIVLDIEGAEPVALEGALETIERCRPAIMIENKGLSRRYGFTNGGVEREFDRIGYRIAERLHNDLIAVPA